MVYSKQRELILKTLIECCCHPTADELYGMVKPQAPGVSLATVYRNLNQLAAHGMAKKVSMPGSADRFDGVMAAHYHLVCQDCGTMVDIPTHLLPNMDKAALQQTGCSITGHDILFYGLCSKCNKSSYAEKEYKNG